MYLVQTNDIPPTSQLETSTQLPLADSPLCSFSFVTTNENPSTDKLSRVINYTAPPPPKKKKRNEMWGGILIFYLELDMTHKGRGYVLPFFRSARISYRAFDVARPPVRNNFPSSPLPFFSSLSSLSPFSSLCPVTPDHHCHPGEPTPSSRLLLLLLLLPFANDYSDEPAFCK